MHFLIIRFREFIRTLCGVFRRVAMLRLEWRFPRSCEILIPFTDTADILANYFPGRSIHILDLESSKRNVWMLLRALPYGKPNVRSYLIAYIRTTKPQLVITLQDNFAPLWHLHGHIGNSKVALIQNGIRTSRPETMPNGKNTLKENPKVDYYFCFNSLIVPVLEERVSAKFIRIGSFRNNHFSRIIRTSTDSVAYISTYRTDVPHTTQIAISPVGNYVTYGEVLGYRVAVVKTLIEYCEKAGLHLRILGKDPDHMKEVGFYTSQLGTNSFQFLPRTPGNFQYEACDTAKFVISTSSTLGLESLARGNRTAILNADSRILFQPEHRFGWPGSLPSEGAFWSTSVTKDRVIAVLDFLNTASFAEWNDLREQYLEYFPVFDGGNTQLVQTLSHLGARTPVELR